MICERCNEAEAKAKFRFCPPCLKTVKSDLRKKRQDDQVRDLNRRGTDQVGRPAMDTKALGGAPAHEDHGGDNDG